MLYNLEELYIHIYYTRFSNFKLIGFLDVTNVNANYCKNHYHVLYNQFEHLAAKCTLKSTYENKNVMPVFFGEDEKFIFNTEYNYTTEDAWLIDSKCINTENPYIILFKGNDDWSVGKRFKTAEDRQEFLDLYGAEAGCEDLEGWN